MKKIFALLLVLVMMLSLVACGGEEEETKAAPEGTASTGANAPAQVSGKPYDTGSFSALIPEGWMESPVTDMWSEDPNALDPDGLQIIKDGTSEYDILTKAYVDIDYYGPETVMMVPSAEWYDGAVTLDPIVTGQMTWNGFGAVSGGNQMYTLYTGEAGGVQYQVVLWCNGDAVISTTDAEVLAILESLTPAA